MTITSNNFGSGAQFRKNEDAPFSNDEIQELLSLKASRAALEEVEKRVRVLEAQVKKNSSTLGELP